MTRMKDHTVLNVRETARLLGIHENTVRNWVERGVLRAYRLPGSGYRRFGAADIDRVRASMLVDAGTFEPRQGDELVVAGAELARATQTA